MADNGSAYHRGEMDIQEHVSTFALFNNLTKWGSLFIASFILLITLWFCTPTGFLGAFVSAAVLAILGTIVLRKGGGH